MVRIDDTADRVGDFRFATDARVARRVAQVDDESQNALAFAMKRVEIERVVEIDVFFVEAAITARAVLPRVAEELRCAIPAEADRNTELAPHARAVDDSHRVDDIAGKSGVVRVDVECARERIALGIERVDRLKLLAAERAIDSGAAS